jgi:hypothetical protein
LIAAVSAAAFYGLLGVLAAYPVLIAIGVLLAAVSGIAWLTARLVFGSDGKRRFAAFERRLFGDELDNNPPATQRLFQAALAIGVAGTELVGCYFVPWAPRIACAAGAALGAVLLARRILLHMGPGFTIYFVAIPAAAGSVVGGVAGMLLGRAMLLTM